MVLIINGVDIKDFSPPAIGAIPANNVSSFRVNFNSTPRAPHSYMQRSVFGDEPFEFRAIDPSTVEQPIGPLETAPGVLSPTATGRPTASLHRNLSPNPGTTSSTALRLRRPTMLANSVETVHPQSQAPAEQSVASGAATAPRSTSEELSFSAIPMAPASRRRPSVVEVRAARQSSVKLAQATKSARLLGSISGPIRSRRTARGRFTNTIRRLKGFATGKYPSERLSISQY
ncbi:hypothetical protein CPB85DRAFT_1541362 [Mucidula mucida]|nr:hypothetical protein CPB85DRAFT_1541362 [Mucidula mucida]